LGETRLTFFKKEAIFGNNFFGVKGCAGFIGARWFPEGAGMQKSRQTSRALSSLNETSYGATRKKRRGH
jgi:hypothetical protein